MRGITRFLGALAAAWLLVSPQPMVLGAGSHAEPVKAAGAAKQAAIPGKRVALIIGNSKYNGPLELANPSKDAAAFAKVLEKIWPKFVIIRAFDIKANDYKEVLDRFEKELQGAEVGLFYFAGHSMQISGENYILPVDVRADPAVLQELHEENVEETLGAVRLSDVLQRMERLTKVKLVFLDACRDNPLVPHQVAISPSEQDGATRSAMPAFSRSTFAPAQGLAPVSATASGSLIAFATSPGMTAMDGAGDNSPFTLALTHHIAEQGADIQEIMLKVNAEVQESTLRTFGVSQIPWVNNSFITKFYLWPWTMEQQLVRLALAEQTELKRLACFEGRPDGKWGADTRSAITAFNARNPAKIRLDLSAPSEEDVRRLIALDSAVCPMRTAAGDKRNASIPAHANSSGSLRVSPSPSLGGGVGIGGF